MTPVCLCARVLALAGLSAVLLSVAVFAQQPPQGEPRAAKASAAKTAQPAKNAPPAAKAVKLTAKQTAFLKNELLPAWQAGDPLVLLRLIGEQIARQLEQQNAALDRALAEEKAPSLGRMLTDARMNLARLGAKNTPEVTLSELVLMLSELERQIQEKIATARKLELFAEPLPSPATLSEFRDHLWNAHVQNNELINAGFLASQGRALLQSPLVAKVKNPSSAQKAAFEIDFAKYLAEVQRLQQDLTERTIELRINRIEFALNLLEGTTDLKQRFLAAYAVGVDGEILILGLKNFKGQLQREKLRSPTLAAELRSNVDHGKELAGGLIKKSELLFAGLHWWRRGRYGRGPEGNGLLKSAAALADPNAQVALFMPRVSPVPVDPAQAARQVPDYDRRHHWTWAWEDRQFETVGMGSATSQSTRPVTETRDISRGHFDGTINDRFY